MSRKRWKRQMRGEVRKIKIEIVIEKQRRMRGKRVRERVWPGVGWKDWKESLVFRRHG